MNFSSKKIINRSGLGIGVCIILASSGHGALDRTPHPLIQEMVTKVQQTKNSETLCVPSAFFRKNSGNNCSAYDFAMLGLATCGHVQGFRESECGKKILKVLGHWDKSQAVTYLGEAVKNNKTDAVALACSVDPGSLKGGLKEVALQACGAAGANPTWKSATPSGASGTTSNQTWKSATPSGGANSSQNNTQTVKLAPTDLASGKLNSQTTKLGAQELASGKLPHDGNVTPVIKPSLKDLEDRTKIQISEIEKFVFVLDKEKQKIDQGLASVGKVKVVPEPLRQGAVLDHSTSPNSSSVTSYDIKTSTENKNNLIEASKKLNESLTRLRSILKQAQTSPSNDSKTLDQKLKEFDAELAKVEKAKEEVARKVGIRKNNKTGAIEIP